MTKPLTRSRSMRLKSFSKESTHDATVFHLVPQETAWRPRNDSPSNQAEAHAAPTRHATVSPNSVLRSKTGSEVVERKPETPHDSATIIVNASGEPSPVVYTTERHSDSAIGIALGSPTQAATWTKLPQPSVSTALRSHPVADRVDSPPPNDMPVSISESPRPRLSRWKSLGGLFGRKASTSSLGSSFHEVQHSPSGQVSHTAEKDANGVRISDSAAGAFGGYPLSGKGRSSSNTRKRARSKPLVDPSIERQNSSDGGNTFRDMDASPEPPPKDYDHLDRIALKGRAPAEEIKSSLLGTGVGPRINVDIPKIEMERYSVMFGNVLHPTQPPSLLARRQGSINKITPLQENALKTSSARDTSLKSQRRATSPAATKSPSFSLSLFPPPDSRRSHGPGSWSSHRPRALQRAHTAPVLLSPSRAASRTPTHNLLAQSPLEEAASTTPTPLTSQSFDKDKTSPVALDESAWEPALKEPHWEMLTKPGATHSESSDQRGHTDAAPTVGQVSIARQISVTRASRKHLASVLLEPERLVDRKALTPTLVELKNRRSQRVQIETA